MTVHTTALFDIRTCYTPQEVNLALTTVQHIATDKLHIYFFFKAVASLYRHRKVIGSMTQVKTSFFFLDITVNT